MYEALRVGLFGSVHSVLKVLVYEALSLKVLVYGALSLKVLVYEALSLTVSLGGTDAPRWGGVHA